MSKKSNTKLLNNIVDILNDALLLDSYAIRSLFSYKVSCNKDLADHPSIQVGILDMIEPNVTTLGVLGLINGIVTNNTSYICGIYEDINGISTLVRFEVRDII